MVTLPEGKVDGTAEGAREAIVSNVFHDADDSDPGTVAVVSTALYASSEPGLAGPVLLHECLADEGDARAVPHVVIDKVAASKE